MSEPVGRCKCGFSDPVYKAPEVHRHDCQFGTAALIAAKLNNTSASAIPVSDVERIAQIRRRLPGLMHQWYGKDVPFLLAALDEANTNRQRLAAENQKYREEREEALRMLRVRDKAVRNLESGLREEQARRQRAIALCDEYEGADGTDYDDLARKFRAALAGERSEQP
jgi:hypothetical protein